jgi:8-oxo-dGTP pyrophosphatase MutT (NUDIX family)
MHSDIMHSDAMSEKFRPVRNLRPVPVKPEFETDRSPGRFVRLSQLRRLRDCEQVAAVCYRMRGGSIEFLLVQTRGSGRWTFPKGSTEPGLTHAQAAALEAFEEAGVHGRIEEAAFTRYVRRPRAGRSTSAKTTTMPREIAVAAHLCEVSRLSPPQEPGRNRTWFSVADARQCLREERSRDDGHVLARVIDRAVVRIEKAREKNRVLGHHQTERLRIDRGDATGRDPLQEVRFDFAEGYGRMDVTSAALKLGGIRRSALFAIDAQRGEIVRGDVLEFGLLRKSKPKALGMGTSVRN